MSHGFNYKYNGGISSDIDIIKDACDHAKDYDPETRKYFLNAIGDTLNYHRMESKWNTRYLPIIGAVFLIIILVLAIVNPFPSRFQTGVMWTILSLAAAGCASLIPGFLEVSYKNNLRATGAIAVFIIMFFFVPKFAEKNDNINPKKDKLSMFVVTNTDSSLQSIVVDFDKSSSENFPKYAATSLSAYLGKSVNADEYTFFRKSDGLIYTKQNCYDIGEMEVLVISNKVLGNFPDKRKCYLTYSRR